MLCPNSASGLPDGSAGSASRTASTTWSIRSANGSVKRSCRPGYCTTKGSSGPATAADSACWAPAAPPACGKHSS
jgi:hypothetical protein